MIDPQLQEEGPQVTPRLLRQFAAIWLVFFGGLAAWGFFRGGRASVAWFWMVLALSVGLPGLVFPLAIRWVFVALLGITWPIGWVISKVLLATMFYGLFLPIGLLFRLLKRDALALRPRRETPTYWLPKSGPADIQGYFRQS
jgi:hypothetical protein